MQINYIPKHLHIEQPPSTPSTQQIKIKKEHLLQNTIAPSFNKLFCNKIRGLIDDRFALKNMEKTKKMFQNDYSVPLDCKIYNYKQRQTRLMADYGRQIFPSEALKQADEINRFFKISLGGVTFIGLLFFGCSLTLKHFTKWGKLTSSGFLPKILVYSILINFTNYFLLVKQTEQIQLMLKYHKYYEKAISKFEQATCYS